MNGLVRSGCFENCGMGLKIDLPKIVHYHFPWQHMATLGCPSFSFTPRIWWCEFRWSRRWCGCHHGVFSISKSWPVGMSLASIGESLWVGLRDTNGIVWRWRAVKFLFSHIHQYSQHDFQTILHLSMNTGRFLAQLKVRDYPCVGNRCFKHILHNFASWSEEHGGFIFVCNV